MHALVKFDVDRAPDLFAYILVNLSVSDHHVGFVIKHHGCRFRIKQLLQAGLQSIIIPIDRCQHDQLIQQRWVSVLHSL